ncbi:MAG TPA: DUF1015 domain-containing protein [Acidimicrobiales bacterium]|nr:DUF1015 domain-containing protein [Acidimicrobiales bacterium]
MPRFEPFRGVLYDLEELDLAEVTAPPYDVIDDAEREMLGERSLWNVVHIDLPAEADGRDRYQNACFLLHQWLDEGVLLTDDEPAFYVYRMGYHDEAGHALQTAGVIGALELTEPGTNGVFPHEQTTPKAHSDRLEMLRSCRANLSAVWGLSLTPGLGALCELPGPPDARWTDDDGVHHRLYRVREPGVIAAIRDAVAASPVVIADGHHRYSTSLAYKAERGEPGGPPDFVMAFIVELAPEQLHVLPIHRLLSAIDPAVDVLAALDPWFESFDAGPLDGAPTITARMADAGALALVRHDGLWLLRPRIRAFDGVDDLDSSRLEAARGALGPHEIAYQHGVANVVARVVAEPGTIGVLLRPATVDQIAATAHAGKLMPPKTTFFAPKPKTGTVFRMLD